MARIQRALASELLGRLETYATDARAFELPHRVHPERLLALVLEVAGDDITFYESADMLIWDISRKAGFSMPGYPLERRGAVEAFLQEFGAADAPAWYERMGVAPEVSHELWKYAAFCARNEQFWRRVILVDKLHLTNTNALAHALLIALAFCMAPTPLDTHELFRI